MVGVAMGGAAVFAGGSQHFETKDKRSYIAFFSFLGVSLAILTLRIMSGRESFIHNRRFPERLKRRPNTANAGLAFGSIRQV